MNRTAFSLMLFTAGVLGISSAQAGPVPPATYSIQFDTVPGAVNVFNAASPQSGTYSYNFGTLDVYASAAATALPAASAGIVSGGCTTGPGGGCAGAYYDAIVTVRYWIGVSGSAGALVPYYFDTAGGITSIGGPTGLAYAAVNLIRASGSPIPGTTGFQASTTLAGDGPAVCGGSGCVNSTQYVSLLVGALYIVEVTAVARAYTNYHSTVTAWADPYIYIDPAFVGGDRFSLLISDGIGNAPLASTPVPAALPLFATGLGVMGLYGWRRKRKAVVH